MKKLAVLLIAIVLVSVGNLWAVTPNDQIEFQRSLAQVGKKAIITDNMGLTEEESKAFWKVYQSYQTDLQAVNDRLLNQIKDYAANYNTMTPEKSKELVRNNLAIQMDQIKLREKYLNKFENVLPPQKVARFYQIENKVDAVVRYELANQIPLMPTSNKTVSQKSMH